MTEVDFTLSSLMEDTSSATRHRVRLRPEGVDVFNVRHNGRDGKMSIILPDNDPNDRESRGTTIEVSSATIVPLFETKIAEANSIYSTPSFKGYYDVYKRNDDNRNANGDISLGLFNDKTAKEKGEFKPFHRIFGLVVQIDGKSIKKYDDKKVTDLIPEDGVVFGYAELSPQKYMAMARELKSGFGEVGQYVAGKMLTLSSVTDASDKIHNLPNSHGSSFVPAFSLKEMSKTSATAFTKAVAPLVKDVIMPYKAQIKEHDALMNQLMLHNMIAPGVVNKLADAGIHDMQTLNDALGAEGNWGKIQAILEGQSTESATSAPVASSARQELAQASEAPFGGEDDAVDVTDDDLPF